MTIKQQKSTPLKLIELAESTGHTMLTVEDAKTLLRRQGWALSPLEVKDSERKGEVLTLTSASRGRVLARARTAQGARAVARWALAAAAPRQRPQEQPQATEEGERLPPLSGLAMGQARALSRGLGSIEEFAIIGGPGTGKSYVTAQLARLLPRPPRLLAPTGKAAEVLSRKVRRQTTTIHSALGLVPGQRPKVDQYDPWPDGTVMVDEASMIDEELFGYLVQALSPASRLLLVGDTNQLPPVGAGQPLLDLLNWQLPRQELTEVYRQGADSKILALAYDLLNGNPHPLRAYESEELRSYLISPSKLLDKAFGYWSAYLRTRPVQDWLILAPHRATVQELNRRIQERLAEDEERRSVTGDPNCKFCVGDRIIFSVNDRSLGYVNGSMGVIVEAEQQGRSVMVTVLSDDGTSYTIPYHELRERAELGYVCTIHKAQGSEAKEVLLVLPSQDSRIMTRPLLYTGVTRAQQKLVILSSESSLQQTANYNPRRSTLLSLLLAEPDLLKQIPERKITDMSYLYEED